jgi:hypothetical protein
MLPVLALAQWDSELGMIFTDATPDAYHEDKNPCQPFAGCLLPPPLPLSTRALYQPCFSSLEVFRIFIKSYALEETSGIEAGPVHSPKQLATIARKKVICSVDSDGEKNKNIK